MIFFSNNLMSFLSLFISLMHPKEKYLFIFKIPYCTNCKKKTTLERKLLIKLKDT